MRILKDFKIPKEKLKIFINKENKYAIDDEIISNIFNIRKIKGKIKYIM